jgi:hypothetical protein
MLFMDLIDGELLNTETDLTVDKVEICLKYSQSQTYLRVLQNKGCCSNFCGY